MEGNSSTDSSSWSTILRHERRDVYMTFPHLNPQEEQENDKAWDQ